MHDIKFIRQNPDLFDEKMKLRGLEPCSAQILKLDEQVRSGKTGLQELQQQANS